MKLYSENELATQVLDAAFRVHRTLGPGLLESAYKECLFYELHKTELRVQKEYALPLIYDAVKLEVGYRIDILVENKLVIEIKSVETFK